MKRSEATATVLKDTEALVRWGNGVQLRDGTHTPEGLESRIRKNMLEPLNPLNAVFIAADLMKLVVTKRLIFDIFEVTIGACVTAIALAGTAAVLRLLYREWRERERREDEE